MKIVHICPTLTEGLSYQENYLTKYHKKLGYDVTVITSYWVYDSNGKLVERKENSYINSDGVKIIRLPLKNNKKYSYKFKQFCDLRKTMEVENPNILFLHGCQWIYIKEIVSFLKGKNISVYVDNHADYSNSATTWLSKYILHGIVWKYYAHMIEPYTKKFYGVLPARVNFLTELYKLPSNKCQLLIMGADDEFVDKAKQKKNILETRNKYMIQESDFLIVTGGKIDAAKQQTLLLMEAVNSLGVNNVKMLIFGTVSGDLKSKFNELLSKNIFYIGWISAQETYNFIAAADMVIYPGRHSVLWEQTVAQGKPMIVKYWKGTTHIDIGGNVRYLYKDNADEIKELLLSLLKTPQYYEMKTKANGQSKINFLYSKIAEESLQ